MDLGWARPLGLLAFALPLALAALLLARRRPAPVATGTFALWRELAAEAPGETRARRSPPAGWAVALLASLALAALALAGPRCAPPADGAAWTALVDRSPSMHLAWTAAGEAAVPDPPTRLARALEAARAWCAGSLSPDDRVRWISAGRDPWTGAPGELPPPDWLAAPGWPLERPDWDACDRPGWIWIADRAPEPAPRAAGLFASGGEAVPGPIGSARRGPIELELAWNGASIEERRVDGPPRRIAMVGDVAPRIAALVALWAEERGLALSDGPVEGAALAIHAPASATAAGLLRGRAGRDGWLAEIEAFPLDAIPDDGRARATWLALPAESGAARVVSFAPGELRLGIARLDEPAGDPAAFALSWARLLDSAVLERPGALALELRQAAGAPLVRPPAGPPDEPRRAEAARRGARTDALLGALASLAGAFFLVLAPRRRGGLPPV